LFVNAAVFATESPMQASERNLPPAVTSEAHDTAAFQPALDRIGRAAGSTGVLVVSLSSGKVLCEFRSKEVLVPASLMKLLTSYAALKELGPSFRFTTRVLAAQEPIEGTVAGDIWIKGSGDPHFLSENALELAK